MGKRNPPSGFQQHQDSIHQSIRQNKAVDFFNELTGPLLFDLTEAHRPVHRERVYPPTAFCRGGRQIAS